MRGTDRIGVLLFFTAAIRLSYADTDARAVQAEFDRCVAQMERADRALRRLESNVDRLKRSIPAVVAKNREEFGREVGALENRLDYFRNRFDRSGGQAEKIRGDLKNISGPTCPSCVESGVNMYCRSAEMLLDEIQRSQDKADELGGRAGAAVPVVSDTDLPGSHALRRAAFDSLDAGSKTAIDGCSDKAADALRRQARASAARADSLFRIGENQPASQALGIAETLLKKAVGRCAGK